MPLIHIYLNEGKTEQEIKNLGDGIHEALMETWNIPENDRFHIIHEKKSRDLSIDKIMWGVERSDDAIVLNIITSPRTKEMKLNFYQRLPEILAQKAHIRPEDIFVSIVTNALEDWSFGNGKAHLIE